MAENESACGFFRFGDISYYTTPFRAPHMKIRLPIIYILAENRAESSAHFFIAIFPISFSKGVDNVYTICYIIITENRKKGRQVK